MELVNMSRSKVDLRAVQAICEAMSFCDESRRVGLESVMRGYVHGHVVLVRREVMEQLVEEMVRVEETWKVIELWLDQLGFCDGEFDDIG